MDNIKHEIANGTIHSNSKKNYFNIMIASGFGLGLAPIAPGTCGALLGIIIHILVAIYIVNIKIQIFALVFFLIIIIIANHLLTPWAVKYWKSDDPSHFVLDEIAGYLIVPILFFYHGELWKIVLCGFLLFRIFDIIKLPGARQIDKKMKNSWGIILDDLVSGVYAVSVMYLLWWFAPQPFVKWLSGS
ncbi:MAG: phosphatidylglycerophosphatase A [Candidatus Hodarchaeota archaeon]